MERIKIEVEKINISVLKKSNLPLFYIHGSGCDSTLWIGQLEEIGGYAIDLPNHGDSDGAEIDSVEDYAKFVVQVVKKTSGKGIIAGHSLGGAIAQMIYLKHRDLVRALILIGTGARLKVFPKILEELSKNTDEAVNFLLDLAFAKKELLKDFKKIFKDRVQILLRDLNICNRFDIIEDFKVGKLRFEIPTLAIVGEKDLLTPVKYSRFFAEFGAEIEIIDNSGHMVMLENPKRVNEVIKRFLKKLNF
ncbi:MAG: alpha/beta hydrolase [Archaeoglobaceae archaeon]|nr:alpha/beta hydrolase [Archaeoglobaceae archaeon]MDW7989290.1 alpha/beta hydrolase [Archaeoglobaceae archaeon]